MPGEGIREALHSFALVPDKHFLSLLVCPVFIHRTLLLPLMETERSSPHAVGGATQEECACLLSGSWESL